ncbi:MAG: cation-transporting P-type ATPase [Betaproteobacteria bacterium]
MPEVEQKPASPPEGLSEAEAQKRLTQNGPNEIVRRGEIGALPYATGTKTDFGNTALPVETAHTVSHSQRAVSYVLTTADLSVIIDAIKETRKIFQRMNPNERTK